MMGCDYTTINSNTTQPDTYTSTCASALSFDSAEQVWGISNISVAGDSGYKVTSVTIWSYVYLSSTTEEQLQKAKLLLETIVCSWPIAT
jgi:hypothetical protein